MGDFCIYWERHQKVNQDFHSQIVRRENLYGASKNSEFAPATAPALLFIRNALVIRVGAGFV